MITVKRFTAAWCGPCRMLKPIFEELKGEYPNVQFEDVNIDVEPNMEIATLYGVQSIPTVVFMDEKGEVARMVGLSPKFRYTDKINELIS